MSIRDLTVDSAHPVELGQPISVFAQLKTYLLNEIREGALGPEDQLPTEFELCEQFGISRTPVHRALAELATEGVVIRHRRRGTFVNPEWVARNVSAYQLNVIVPEGPWEALLAEAAPADIAVNATVVDLPTLRERLIESVANGTAPDLAVLDSVWVPELASNGFLRALDELNPSWTSGEYRREFASTFVESHTINDAVVAVQVEADVAGLWYDREALNSRHLSPPSTWSELTAACTEIVAESGRAALALPGGPAAGEAASYTLLALLASNGVVVLDDDGVALDDPRAIRTLEFIESLATDGLLSRGAVNWSRGRPIELLASGDVAFAFGGSYALPALAAASGLTTDSAWSRFGFLPMPQGPDGPPKTLAGGMALAVFRQSEHPEVAMRLLEAMVGAESQLRMARLTGQVPSRTSVVDECDDTALLSVSSGMLSGAVVRPSVSTYDRVSYQLQVMFADVILGRVSPMLACQRTAALVAAITGLTVR